MASKGNQSAKGDIAFFLELNEKTQKERIIIGRVNRIQPYLDGKDAQVDYDKTRPLGTMLFDFEQHSDGEWEKISKILQKGITHASPVHIPFFAKTRWTSIEPVYKFSSEKFYGNDPIAMYAIVRTWEEYKNCFDEDNAKDTLKERLSMLHKPFSIYSDFRPWEKEAIDYLSEGMQDEEAQAILWNPIPERRPREALVITSSSFLPVINYYLKKVAEWGYFFKICKVEDCKKPFLTQNSKVQICSEDCRKKQAIAATEKNAEKSKESKEYIVYKSAYQAIYNFWRKVKKLESTKPEEVAKFANDMAEFRKDGLLRKEKVTKDKRTIAEFSTWLRGQVDSFEIKMNQLIGKMPK